MPPLTSLVAAYICFIILFAFHHRSLGSSTDGDKYNTLEYVEKKTAERRTKTRSFAAHRSAGFENWECSTTNFIVLSHDPFGKLTLECEHSFPSRSTPCLAIRHPSIARIFLSGHDSSKALSLNTTLYL